ncbi:glutamine synthetase family protein [Streptomyces sp. NBC_01601]|uniref:glutamine synthetase family protein n=1 Tax=Streptomyces sp. NBC_01601 TaxID=2975892 RepID=UPI002E2A5C31|nr:glutamine synthetase family protein [Streptomyces sp. NBC_01601]
MTDPQFALAATERASAGPRRLAQPLKQLLDGLSTPGRPVESVWLTVVDPHGRLKGKRYSRAHFESTHAFDMCGYLMASDGRNNPLPTVRGWDAGYPDMTVLPDAESIAVMPAHRRVAHLFAQALDAAGDPLAVDPHTILDRQLRRLSQLGLHAKIGLETEFVLFHGTREDLHRSGYRSPRPAFARNLDYSADPPPAVHSYIGTLSRALTASGHPVEAIKCEGAPGQLEITFPYGDPLNACRQHLRMQMAAMRLAERARMTASFMAAPDTGVGSGFHVHLSLWKSDDPVFAEPDGDEAGTDLLEQAIGGLLQVLPEMAPLYAPTVNSYRRYQDDSFAPTHFNWGNDNRTCAVRVIGEGASRHLEIRLPGADSNPFLTVAAVIAGIVHGLTHGTKPPQAVTGNGYADPSPIVPGSLDDALQRFEAGQAAHDALGGDVVTHYTALGRATSSDHARRVTDTDREMWFSRA